MKYKYTPHFHPIFWCGLVMGFGIGGLFAMASVMFWKWIL